MTTKSRLEHGKHGRALWKYWTRGPGLAKWNLSPHPYTALTRALRRAGVPARSVPGLAANIFKQVRGIYPGQRLRNRRG